MEKKVFEINYWEPFNSITSYIEFHPDDLQYYCNIHCEKLNSNISFTCNNIIESINSTYYHFNNYYKQVVLDNKYYKDEL